MLFVYWNAVIICHQWAILNSTESVIFSLFALLRFNSTNSNGRKKGQWSNISAANRTKLLWAICSSCNAFLVSDSSWWTSRASYEHPSSDAVDWNLSVWEVKFRTGEYWPTAGFKMTRKHHTYNTEYMFKKCSESRCWASFYCFRNTGANSLFPFILAYKMHPIY